MIKTKSFWEIFDNLQHKYFNSEIDLNHYKKYIKLLIDTSVEQSSHNKFLLKYTSEQYLELQTLIEDKFIYLNSYYSHNFSYIKYNEMQYRYKDFQGFNDYQLLTAIRDKCYSEKDHIIQRYLEELLKNLIYKFELVYKFKFYESFDLSYLYKLTIEIINENLDIYSKLFDNKQTNNLIFLEKLKYFIYFSKNELNSYNYEIIHCDSLHKLRCFIRYKEMYLYDMFSDICEDENIEFIVRDSEEKRLDINYINELILNNDYNKEVMELLEEIKESYIKLTNLQSIIRNKILGLNTELLVNKQSNLFTPLQLNK